MTCTLWVIPVMIVVPMSRWCDLNPWQFLPPFIVIVYRGCPIAMGGSFGPRACLAANTLPIRSVVQVGSGRVRKAVVPHRGVVTRGHLQRGKLGHVYVVKCLIVSVSVVCWGAVSHLDKLQFIIGWTGCNTIVTQIKHEVHVPHTR